VALIEKETRDKIIAQALTEIEFARRYKQGKIANWQKNEDMYYGKKVSADTSRANVELGRMAEFVHTLLSKIDNPLLFKFAKRKESQLKRVQRLNALKIIDQQRDNWDVKDLAGKKQAIIYGRAIYSYYADSEKEYTPHLDNIDVYDFLIDPAGGGLDIERAMYLGDYGVVLTKSELKEGIKNKSFLRTETNQLIDGVGNADQSSQEQTNKNARTFSNNATTSQKQIANPDKFIFWRWGTTYEGERYYLLLSATGATAIRIEKLSDVFESNLWWYWTWAAFLDLTEFWTPAYCDYVREIFMAQSVSVNQSLDNSEQITKPQKVVNVGAIENLAELKYKRDGYIKVKRDFDVNKALQVVPVPSIDTPLKMFELLEGIQEKASGVNASAKGTSDEDKVGIYQGNEANTADRFGLLNKSYAFGYKRFAKLWDCGVREHLVKKTAVDLIGPDGIDVEMVSRRDIYRKGEEFGTIVEASDAELALSTADKRNKLAFLSGNVNNPVQNPKKAYELSAAIVGFKEEDIRQLQDTSEFGNAELMSEAERDIERLLDGEKIQPNSAATTAYKQRFVDYMTDHQEDMSDEDFRTLADYVLLLDLPGVGPDGMPLSIIMRNTVRNANMMAQQMSQQMMQQGGQQGGQQPAPQQEDAPTNEPLIV